VKNNFIKKLATKLTLKIAANLLISDGTNYLLTTFLFSATID
jgi:hypothetical protein